MQSKIRCAEKLLTIAIVSLVLQHIFRIEPQTMNAGNNALIKRKVVHYILFYSKCMYYITEKIIF